MKKPVYDQDWWDIAVTRPAFAYPFTGAMIAERAWKILSNGIVTAIMSVSNHQSIKGSQAATLALFHTSSDVARRFL